MIYDYLFLTLQRVPTPHPALAAQLKDIALPGGEIVAQFAPQLGWANNEAAVLVRWTGAAGDLQSIAGLDMVATAKAERLTPTLRPVGLARPQPGGIYVHRWFEVDEASADEFVQLSGQGWEHFEASFDTNIFGLFRAEPASGVARLLLITRYADHGVWEASRDPTTEAMQIFARRQQLTRRSWAASARLV